MTDHTHSRYSDPQPMASTHIFTRLGDFMLDRKWFLVVLVAAITVFAVGGMGALRFDNSNEVWFVEDDPNVKLLDKFRDIFGNEDFVVLLFESKDFFEPENIRLLSRLARDLETQVPHIKEMTWLGNVEYIEGTKEGIAIYGLLDTIPGSGEEMNRVREKALNEASYINSLVAGNGKAYTIVLEMEKYPEDGPTLDPESEIAPKIREILERPEFAGLRPHMAGGPVFHYDFDQLAGSETPKFMALCLMIQMALLAWLGRGWRGVAVPVTIVVISIIWTMGAIGWIGFTLNTMIIILPSLLICVGIGDSIHFISEYQDRQDRGMPRRQAMVKAFSVVGLPCLLTTVTTMGAFLSFLTVSMKPFREFGIYAAIGVVTALLLTCVMVPFFYSFGMKKKTAPAKGKQNNLRRSDFFDRLLNRIYKLVCGRPKLVAGFFTVLVLFSLVGAMDIRLESGMVELLSSKVPIRRAYDFIDSRMGGSMSMEIMLDTGRTGGVKTLEFLGRMDRLQAFLDAHPMVTKTSSIVDVIKKMRRALHNNDPAFYAIPDTSEAAAQYMFLYEISGGGQMDKLIGYDYDIARLTVKMPTMGTAEVNRFIGEVEAFADPVFKGIATVEITGAMALTKALNDRMAEGLKSSFLAVLVAVTLMMILFLRSVKLGLISMVPNVFPALITLGVMGFFNIAMSIPLMCCSSIIIGVAVDDTIHFFRRYRREFKACGTYACALESTLATVGRPITFTTLTLILGFMVMVLSVMKGWSNFGFLAGFAFFWALLADFFFAPALILLFKPLGPERAN
ncbi:MAG: RND family transporter [Desulfobacteraceae bacterium]|nr:RND family transporter [Desulfobacteraceae bacterium]